MKGFSNPEEVVEHLNLYGAMKIADFGAHAGFWALPLARHITSEGVVYALDVQREPLRLLAKRAGEANLHNIRVMHADLERSEGSKLKADSIDLVLVAHILFQVTEKMHILKEAHRILKKGARIVLVEWDTIEPRPIGPAHEHRIDKKELERLLTEAQFENISHFNLSNHHYGIIAHKK